MVSLLSGDLMRGWPRLFSASQPSFRRAFTILLMMSQEEYRLHACVVKRQHQKIKQPCLLSAKCWRWPSNTTSVWQIFLTVWLTVSNHYETSRYSIHAGFKPLFNSTYPKNSAPENPAYCPKHMRVFLFSAAPLAGQGDADFAALRTTQQSQCPNV